MNFILASLTDLKIVAVKEWIEHHVSPEASYEWHPLGFLPFPELPSWLPLQGLMMILVTIIIFVLFAVLYKKKNLAPQGFIAKFFEPFILFVRDDIAIDSMGEKEGRKWTPFFCSLFFFILGCNLIGLIPGNATATGSYYITGSLSLIIFFCMTVVTILKFGPVRFFKAFCPEGVPTLLLFLLAPLEMIGLVVKCFALMIRLFANMFAGHVVLFCLMALIYVFGFMAAPIFFIALGVVCLEIFVAFLQAYLFTLLSSIFIGEVFHHAHGHDEEHAH